MAHQATVVELAAPQHGWLALLRDHARRHASTVLGLGRALLGVLALLAQSLWQLAEGGGVCHYGARRAAGLGARLPAFP